MTVSFEEWKNLDLRVGRIVNVEEHPNADRLYVIEVDLGPEKRKLVAGLKSHYKPEELKNKLCIVFTNLEPAVIRGIKSNGMVLAAVTKDKISLIVPDSKIDVGAKIE